MTTTEPTTDDLVILGVTIPAALRAECADLTREMTDLVAQVEPLLKRAETLLVIADGVEYEVTAAIEAAAVNNFAKGDLRRVDTTDATWQTAQALVGHRELFDMTQKLRDLADMDPALVEAGAARLEAVKAADPDAA